MKGFMAQSKAEALRLIRSPFFLLFSIGMPLTFYSLFAVLNGADTQIGHTTWGAYSLMSMTAFSLIGTAAGQFGIRLAYERKEGLLKLLKLTPMPMAAWAAAKMVSHLLVHVFIIVVMFSFSAIVFGTEMPAGQWMMSGVWLLLGSIPFLALGLLLGTIKSPEAATAISNLVYMGISVAGGLWMPLSTFPEWMQKLGQWLPSHAYANTSWTILAGGASVWSDIAVLAGYGIVFLAAAVFLFNRREAA
jgi:ABC-2 type transport system permease protein